MCDLYAKGVQIVRAADCNPFVKKGQSPFLTVSAAAPESGAAASGVFGSQRESVGIPENRLRQHRTIASASLRRLFAPLLQFEKREIHTVQRVKKASQSLPPAGGKGILIIFCRGVYLTENTTQAASVRFVRQRRTNRARGRLQSFCQKRAKPFFDSLNGTITFRSPVCGQILMHIVP